MKEKSVNYRHGMEGSVTYRAWSSMKQRCLNPKKHNYHHYGGRGIKVCERWLEFSLFYADMGECQPGFSLERIDVNGDYEPGNCKWIPTHEQQRNKRRSVTVEIDGEKMSLKEACLKLGLNYRTVQSRMNIMGWTMLEALGLDVRTKSSQANDFGLLSAA
jgi:hypothetical protein